MHWLLRIGNGTHFKSSSEISPETYGLIMCKAPSSYDLSRIVLISIDGHTVGRKSPPSFDNP